VPLADITDAEMRAGCEQIYAWAQDYISGMYANPDRYSVYSPYVLFRMLDDLMRTLPDDLKRYAAEMHEYILSKGAKLESHKYYCYFRYKLGKENVLMLRRNSWKNTPLDIVVPYRLERQRRIYRVYENR